MTGLSRLLPLLAAVWFSGWVRAAEGQVLMDFEKPRDGNAWEVKSGSAPVIAAEGALAGTGSLKVALESTFATTLLPRDWSAHGRLVLDYRHGNKTPVALTLSIGDLAWLDTRSLWNQFNQTFLLPPGAGSISVPVRELPRGMGEQMFLDLKSNLDPAAIVWVQLECRGGPGVILFDNLRLEDAAGSALAAPAAPAVQMPATTVAPAPAPATPAAPPAPGTRVLVDFETIRDQGLWEQRGGALRMETVAQHATSREKALRVGPGTLLVTENIAPDWSAHAEFAFDVHFAGEGGASVELMIGDGAWIGQQNYWNRHNSIHRLAPGPNTVRVPLAELYRGEPGRRNTWIKRNLDVNQIAALSLNFVAAKGEFFLDNLRLQGTAAPAAPAGVPVAAAPAGSAPGVPASPAVAAPAPAARGPRVLADFEQKADLGIWEVRTGPPLEIRAEHPGRGRSSARVQPSNLIATESLPRDWSGCETFAFDVFNATEGLVKVEVLLGDDAWFSSQNYWNRHNSIHALAPGSNTVEIALGNLYRGEASARNRGDIKRNLDVDKIAFLSLTFLGKASSGDLFLDNLRLEGSAPLPAVPVTAAPAAPSAAPAPGAAAPAAGAPAAAVAGDKVVFDFEGQPDLSKFEVRAGPAPAIVAEHPTRGAHSLRVGAASHLATYEIPRDWRGYEALEFDVFNAGERLAKVEVLIGDDAWSNSQNYWNRHNSIHALAPGASTVSIPVSGLYRGEASARNRGDVKRNIDPDSIAFFSLTFTAGPGEPNLYLDNVRLTAPEGGVVPVLPAAPVAPAPAGAGAAAPAVPAATVDLVFCGFETPQDLARWEAREGAGPALVAEHATQGAKSLRAEGGCLIATYEIPRDWRPYAELAIDVFNPSDKLMRIEFLAGDDAWIGSQNYWNRHNSIHAVAPGAGTIRIPVQNMYRGEASARNRGDVKRNIDTDKMTFISLKIHGAGPLFLDNFRLSPGEDARPAGPGGAASPPGGASAPPPAATPPATAPRVWGFDFGPASQAVWPGFREVTWNTVYDRAAGFGLERAQARESYAGDTGWPSRLLQDYVWIEKGEFLADLPNGRYDVWVFFEESGYWAEEQTRHTRRAIIAEGADAVTEDRTGRGEWADAKFLFESREPLPGTDPLQVCFDLLHRPKAFTVEVSDGQLNLGFFEDRRLSARVAAVMITVAGDAAGAAWRDQVMARNLREARTRMAGLPLKPSGTLDALPESVRRNRGIVFHPPAETTPGVLQVPPPEWLQEPAARSTAPGASAAFPVGLFAREALSGITATAGELSGPGGVIAATNVVARAARLYARRDLGEPVYRVEPWYLVDARNIDAPAGMNRLFWVNVEVPAGTAAGSYAGRLRLAGGEFSAEVPLRVEVLPFTLVPSGLAISAFGMPEDTFPLFARYGFTSPCGGPQVQVTGWDGEKQPQLQIGATTGYIEAARAAGLTAEVFDYGGPVSIKGLDPQQAEGFFARLGAGAGLDARTAAKRVFDRLQAFSTEHRWGDFMLNLVDEPLNRGQVDNLLRSSAFLREVAPWLKQGGFYSFRASGDPLGGERLFRALDSTITKGYDASIMEEALREKRRLYLYSLGRSRFTFGPLLYRHRLNGVKGYVEWHSWIVHGYQFNDFDGREPDSSLIVYCTEGVRPTLDLERIRLGIQDLRYLVTLESRIAETRAAGRTAPAAAAQAKLDELMKPVTGARGKPDSLDLDALRAKVIELILSLR